MLMDITHYPSKTLAELHDAGLLFFDYYPEHGSLVDPKPTTDLLWSNTEWAYDQRREHRLCQLLINIEE